jgi:hypothetical protein
MQKSKLESCVKLTRTLPLHKIEKNLSAISSLIYEDDDLLNSFLQKVDSPLEVCKDDVLGEFIKCEYNRDGDSYKYKILIYEFNKNLENFVLGHLIQILIFLPTKMVNSQ